MKILTPKIYRYRYIAIFSRKFKFFDNNKKFPVLIIKSLIHQISLNPEFWLWLRIFDNLLLSFNLTIPAKDTISDYIPYGTNRLVVSVGYLPYLRNSTGCEARNCSSFLIGEQLVIIVSFLPLNAMHLRHTKFRLDPCLSPFMFLVILLLVIVTFCSLLNVSGFPGP